MKTPERTKETFGLLIDLEERYDRRLRDVSSNNSSVRST